MPAESSERQLVDLPGPCPKCGYCHGYMVMDLANTTPGLKPMLLKCARCRKTVAKDHTPIEEEM